MPPKQLSLFDGSSNSIITEAVVLPVSFPSRHSLSVKFYLTLLDTSTMAVLGYSWLTKHNPSIDWSSSSIIFQTPVECRPARASPPASATPTSLPPPAKATLPTPPLQELATKPSILLINSVAFARACCEEGAVTFELAPASSDVLAKSATVDTPDLTGIPEEYHKFANIFSKACSETLAPHWPYNLKIDLEEGAVLPPGCICSLSQAELLALCKFVNENLNTGFICLSKSAHRVPVLFVKKKDSSLWLCVDYCRLNWISQKDCYPLLLITNLLDTSQKGWIYIKIDLCHAYHLVWIAARDKWKMSRT